MTRHTYLEGLLVGFIIGVLVTSVTFRVEHNMPYKISEGAKQ